MNDLKEVWRVWSYDPLQLALFLLFAAFLLRADWNMRDR